MRYNLFIYLFINIIILTCESGCPLFDLLVTSKTTVHKKENINPEKLKLKETPQARNSITSIITTPIENVSSDISTLKKTNKNGDAINKKKEGISYTDSNTEESPKKKAQNFIREYLKYTSKQANFTNNYSLKNYNDFKKDLIEKFIKDVFNDINKTETGLFLYYSIIAFFDTVRSPRSGTYAKEFGNSVFFREEKNVKMCNLILLKLLCDILDLNVISQNVMKDKSKVQFYTFISSFNIKSLFNYLTPSNFFKFFFDEDYFKEYKRQLDNLKNYKEISDDTAFYENNVVIRAFLNKFEVFKKNNPAINECKDMFSLESLDKFFVFVRKMIFNTSHLFMMFLYEKFDDCFLPLEEKSLTVAINSKDDFSKILNEALKEHNDGKKRDELYKESYYNDAAKNCTSVIRNTIIVLNTINPISEYVTKKDSGLRETNFSLDEKPTLKDRMKMAPLEWLLNLIENKNEVYTMSNKLTSLCNLYGQHKFLHYYLVKDNQNTIFPIQNKFYDSFFQVKEKLIFKRYQKIFKRIKAYDNIWNVKVVGDQSGLYPKVSQKHNSLFKTIIYK